MQTLSYTLYDIIIVNDLTINRVLERAKVNYKLQYVIAQQSLVIHILLRGFVMKMKYQCMLEQ